MTAVDAASRLDIENLSRSFGETKALLSATLRVAAGEIHSLAGENGVRSWRDCDTADLVPAVAEAEFLLALRDIP